MERASKHARVAPVEARRLEVRAAKRSEAWNWLRKLTVDALRRGGGDVVMILEADPFFVNMAEEHQA